MSDDSENLADALKAAAKGPKKPRSKSQLTCAAPAAGATSEVLLAWLTDQLKLPEPIVGIKQYGHALEGVITFTMSDGTAVRFEPARGVFHPTTILQQVYADLAGRGTIKPLGVFTQQDAADFGGVVMRAVNAEAADDARQEASEWAESFIRALRPADFGRYADPAERWRALSWLANERAYDARLAVSVRGAVTDERDFPRPPAIRWHDGTVWARFVDFQRHLRESYGPRITPGGLHGRMAEIGWEHVTAQAWRPGAERGPDNRVKFSAYLIPADPEEAA